MFRTASLLFVSGLCALVYQTVWMRELRLVFGASTLAGAAVLAIFMGGLGAGAAILGRRSDTHPRPLRFYGLLECGIATAAALTPFLIDAVRALYIASGGSVTLGPAGATLLRLLFAALVLAVPTFLMGGTLSAAARAVTTEDDTSRHRVAWLYAVNTCGAVTGVLLAGFVLLERFGNRQTLWLAAALNLVVGLLGVWWRPSHRSGVRAPNTRASAPLLNRRPILVAAMITGLVFLLMELVWYRMLSPILGGTTFMFALVLAMALAGIGIGGALYSRWRDVSAGALAAVLAAEALAIALPYALGDRIALLAHSLRDGSDFSVHVAGWALVTAIVVLPASIVAGVQFPLLIALLGRGGEDVGRDVGHAYAWNTAGAIGGSLLGGFVLIPRLGATGCWRLCVAMLVILAASFALRARRTAQIACSTLIGGAAVVAIFTSGPTALWRHSGIGAGRAPIAATTNDARAWAQSVRRTLLAEAEGRESSIALVNNDDLGLVVNGKSDGSARRDAGTQVMAGMIAALLHPEPRTSMVVGLGTGTTAGWLAAVPSMQRVDVVELEPAVLEMARAYAGVNRDAMSSPRVHVTLNDARETLLVSKARYDVIFSEPSNPYRAGVASLYTREFYEAVRARLADGGIFAQWVQTYSIDAATAHTIYATMAAVFPHVQTWTTNPGDVVLVASAKPIDMNADALRARLAREPFRGAAHVAWRAETLEGVLSHFIADERVANAFAKDARELNTDDRSVIEFGFARTLGRDSFGTNDIIAAAERLRGERPRMQGAVDWELVAANRAALSYLASNDERSIFARTYAAGEFGTAAAAWRDRQWTPATSRQLASLAHVLAVTGDEHALTLAEELRAWQPAEADAIVGLLRMRQGRVDDAAPAILRALTRYREDPWPLSGLMESVVSIAPELVDHPTHAEAILDALSRPYSAYQLEEVRRLAYVAATWRSGRCSPRNLGALNAMEPHAVWMKPILEMRVLCYENAALTQLALRAKQDLKEFQEGEKAGASGSGRGATAIAIR
ncbi:MAG TPA: fused MFS/spermidine synthase [Thermoanaerobaculia bacterium]